VFLTAIANARKWVDDLGHAVARRFQATQAAIREVRLTPMPAASIRA
jgi:hypothetical protein